MDVLHRWLYEKTINWHTEQVAYFLKKARSLDQGGSSLLDNSMIMFQRGPLRLAGTSCAPTCAADVYWTAICTAGPPIQAALT